MLIFIEKEGDIWRIFQNDSDSSRSITEAYHWRALFAFGCVTAPEYRVLLVFIFGVDIIVNSILFYAMGGVIANLHKQQS